MLDLGALLALAAQCAPTIAAETLISIVDVESRSDPLAIGVNSGARPVSRPKDTVEAARAARALIDAGGSVDLGIAQINSANLWRLGLSVEDAFETCANLNAAARILSDNYRTALKTQADPQAALRVALSLYNTGDRQRGVRNGYVARVEASARRVVPAIRALAPASPANEAPPPARLPDPADHDVFARARPAALVFGHPQAARITPSPDGDIQ